MGLVEVRACSDNSLMPSRTRKVVILNEDSDNRAGMCSADAQTLPGDHDHAVFWDSSLHALRPGRRWRWKR
jgi:hypothetical protein